MVQDARSDVDLVPIEFRVLGALEVVRAGVSLNLGSPKQRAVLGALAVAAGRTVSVDQLVETVWGDRPPRQALLGVQAYISKLRGLFQGAGFEKVRLVRRPPGYALETAAIDLVEFRALVVKAETAVGSGRWADAYTAASRAVGLWRGPMLADFMDEPWVMSEAAPAAELFAQCREALATALLGESRVGEAVARSQALVEAYPLRERAWWLLIVSLHRAGRSPEALESFQRFATELDDQLGLQPGPDFRWLQTAILQHDPSLAVWPNQPDAPVQAPEPHQLGRQSTASTKAVPGSQGGLGWQVSVVEPASARNVSPGNPIVGRQDQLSVIDAALDDVVAGGRQWLLLTGPAGIGKTRLADEAGVLAQRKGALVVSTTCPDDDGTPAWWPLRPLVAGLGGDPDVIFLPPDGVDADTMRFAVYQRLAGLLASRAQDQPVVILIDDAQWLDLASTRLLTFLIRSRGLPRTGLVLTVREEQSGSAIPPVITALGQEWAAVHVAVPPLDGVAATELLNQTATEAVTASEAFSLTRRTGGNPLLLIEYARLPATERRSGKIPIAARGLLNRRLSRLPEQVLHVLRAAAVAGETFELDLVARALELNLIDVIDRLDAAAAENIIGPAPTGHGYQFLHALLRDELLLQLSVMRRQALHARVADVLNTRGRDPRTLLQRAQHLTAALAIVDPAVVEQACRDAAEDAETRWDWDTAARQWDAALTALQLTTGWELAGRDALLVARLRALARAGHGQTVLDVVNTALDDAAREGQTSTIGRLAASLLRTTGAWSWANYGADPSAVAARLEGLVTVVSSDPAAHARVLAALAVGNSYAPTADIPDAQSRLALQIAERLDNPDVLADALLGRILAFGGIAGRATETVAALDRLHVLPHRAAATDEVQRHNILTMVLLSQGDMSAVATHLTEGIEGSDRLRLPVTRVQLRWAEATLAQWHGQLDQADALVAKAYQRHVQTELYGADRTYTAARLALLWDRGRVNQNLDLVSESAEPLVWGAVAAAEAGDRTAGHDMIARRLARGGPEYWYTLAYTTLMAHAAADLGDDELAAPLLEHLAARTWAIACLGQAGCMGPVALATGRLRALLGDVPGARTDLATAEELATTGNGRTAMLRIRLAQFLLEPVTSARAASLRGLQDEAHQAGMAGVAAAARAASASTARAG